IREPNNAVGLWNTSSEHCYAGIAPPWYVKVWTDHNRKGVVTLKSFLDQPPHNCQVNLEFPTMHSWYVITHLLSVFPQNGTSASKPTRRGTAFCCSPIRFIQGGVRVWTARQRRSTARICPYGPSPCRKAITKSCSRTMHRVSIAGCGSRCWRSACCSSGPAPP